MLKIFPEPILKLPKALIPLEGVKGYISQAEDNQIVFIEFEKDVIIPKHSHGSQWEIVLNGKADVVINGKKKTYSVGENFFIPANIPHSAKVYAGYASLAFFSDKNRYKTK
jgi:quercetin dioxygenase-like cupin family protein